MPFKKTTHTLGGTALWKKLRENPDLLAAFKKKRSDDMKKRWEMIKESLKKTSGDTD